MAASSAGLVALEALFDATEQNVISESWLTSGCSLARLEGFEEEPTNMAAITRVGSIWLPNLSNLTTQRLLWKHSSLSLSLRLEQSAWCGQSRPSEFSSCFEFICCSCRCCCCCCWCWLGQERKAKFESLLAGSASWCICYDSHDDRFERFKRSQNNARTRTTFEQTRKCMLAAQLK